MNPALRNANPDPEVLHQRAAAGGEAEALAKRLFPFLDARKEQIVNEAVGWFRSNETQSDKTAIRYIAALSEIEAQRQELQSRMRAGEHARAQLHNTTA
jgi:hypothetical protein